VNIHKNKQDKQIKQLTQRDTIFTWQNPQMGKTTGGRNRKNHYDI